jgi:hypothetical protein
MATERVARSMVFVLETSKSRAKRFVPGRRIVNDVSNFRAALGWQAPAPASILGRTAATLAWPRVRFESMS